MNDVLKIIYNRRAVRKYADKLVSKSSIEDLLDAGRMAPSAMNNQCWKFYIVTNKEDIKLYSHEIIKAAFKSIPKISIKKITQAILSGVNQLFHGIKYFQTNDPVFHKVPVVIFIAAPKDNEWAALDVGMCSQNIMLAAKSIGLDSCPIGFGKYIEKTKSYSKFGISSNDQVHLAIIVGYGDETPEPHKRNKENAFYIE